jgi:hypothetical protein
MNPFYFHNSLLLIILVIWTIPWKIYALWLAVKHNHKGWFVALVILNTLSILEIIYVFYVAKKSWDDVKKALMGVISSSK